MSIIFLDTLSFFNGFNMLFFSRNKHLLGQNFKMSSIKRQANNVTHLLARASLSYNSFKVEKGIGLLR